MPMADRGDRLLAVLRHGPTDWNADKRLQGRVDRPLSGEGVIQVRSWRLPDAVPVDVALYSSPLARAVETAELVVGRPPITDDRLTEMDWGAWEGLRVSDLRRDLGADMARNEDRGLDFRPEGGESPRDVVERVRPFLKERADKGGAAVAVSHKGVIRVLLALSTGWDMTGKSPVKLDWSSVHLFSLDVEGRPSLVAPNLSMTGK